MRHPKADEDKRQNFQKKIEKYRQQGKSIVYLDESGFAHHMPRTHGYAPRGQCVLGKHDWQAKGRTNVIGALIGATLLTVSLFQSNINADIFHAWMTQDLFPKLPPGSIIVMDNATFHKRNDTKTAIGNAKHVLEYLPPYLPDLNPIKHKWAQAKNIRKAKQCSIQNLFEENDF